MEHDYLDRVEGCGSESLMLLLRIGKGKRELHILRQNYLVV
jgi:hypothetical protein